MVAASLWLGYGRQSQEPAEFVGAGQAPVTTLVVAQPPEATRQLVQGGECLAVGEHLPTDGPCEDLIVPGTLVEQVGQTEQLLGVETVVGPAVHSAQQVVVQEGT